MKSIKRLIGAATAIIVGMSAFGEAFAAEKEWVQTEPTNFIKLRGDSQWNENTDGTYTFAENGLMVCDTKMSNNYEFAVRGNGGGAYYQVSFGIQDKTNLFSDKYTILLDMQSYSDISGGNAYLLKDSGAYGYIDENTKNNAVAKLENGSIHGWGPFTLNVKYEEGKIHAEISYDYWQDINTVLFDYTDAEPYNGGYIGVGNAYSASGNIFMSLSYNLAEKKSYDEKTAAAEDFTTDAT